MKEREMQTAVRKWVESGGWRVIREKVGGSVAFEYKTEAAGKSIAYSRIAPHQIAGLLAAEGWGSGDAYSGGVYMKLSDLLPGAKPFDAFYLGGAKGFVIFGWYHKGKGYHCACVEICHLIDEIGEKRIEGSLKVKRGSLNEDKGLELCRLGKGWEFWC